MIAEALVPIHLSNLKQIWACRGAGGAEVTDGNGGEDCGGLCLLVIYSFTFLLGFCLQPTASSSSPLSLGCLFPYGRGRGRYLSNRLPHQLQAHCRARLSCGISTALWVLVLIHLGLGLVAEGRAYFTHSTPSLNTPPASRTTRQEQLKCCFLCVWERALHCSSLPLAITAFCTLRSWPWWALLHAHWAEEAEWWV
ncbi:hypothetical protein AAFF_G00249770 [Aldrovandia affinis]|uniref:Uncharacterized protein n=1 Tax=Aldrovandia affinis TaxID=143900 RepID=A0AAD7QZN2_9TELE|nr:hypothetical protein AAFF_G00249770 [Aldrovandia affinis]